MKGRIISLHDTYGFIKSDEGINYYFNATSTVGRTEFSMLEYGSEVEFTGRMLRPGWRAYCLRLCEKPAFVWEEGAIYVNRASNRLRHWYKGRPSCLEPWYQILVSTEFVTEYFPVREDARQFFFDEAKSAGANFVQDVEIEASVSLILGHASTTYRYRGVVGIALKPKKAKDTAEAEKLTRLYQSIIKKRLGLFKAFEFRHRLVRTLDLRHDKGQEQQIA